MCLNLTNEQAKLVEDNHNLIFSFLNKHHLDDNSTEDWYGVAAIGLCKAAMSFDPNKNMQFSTLAYRCMENEVRHEMRRQKRSVQVSLSMESPTDKKDGEGIAEHIQDKFNTASEAELLDVMDVVKRTWSERDLEILTMLATTDLTTRQIGDRMGVSGSTVSGVKAKFKNLILGGECD